MSQVHLQVVAGAIHSVLSAISIRQSPVEVNKFKDIAGVQGATVKHGGLVKVERVLNCNAISGNKVGQTIVGGTLLE